MLCRSFAFLHIIYTDFTFNLFTNWYVQKSTNIHYNLGQWSRRASDQSIHRAIARSHRSTISSAHKSPVYLVRSRTWYILRRTLYFSLWYRRVPVCGSNATYISWVSTSKYVYWFLALIESKIFSGLFVKHHYGYRKLDWSNGGR